MLPESRIREIAQTVDQLLSSYEKVDRTAQTLAFAYRGGQLLLVCDGDWRVALWHNAAFPNLGEVERKARGFLRQVAKQRRPQD